MNRRTKQFLQMRKVSLLLPWLGIVGMAVLVFSLIMKGFLTFFTEIGLIANFYYLVDEYNWIAERITYDKEELITHKRDNIVRMIRIMCIFLVIVTSVVLCYLRNKNIFLFVNALAFISSVYFGNHTIDSLMVIFRIELNNWKKFYIWVGIGTGVLLLLNIFLLSYYLIIFYVLLGIILIVYLFTYYWLARLYEKTEDNLGGHKYLIDLPDKRFGMRG